MAEKTFDTISRIVKTQCVSAYEIIGAVRYQESAKFDAVKSDATYSY